MGYAWEKLFAAVLSMASSTETLQVRLANAYVYNLIHIRPEENLPEDLRPQLAEITAALTAREALGDEGRAMASALAMSDLEAHDMIERVVSLYNSVTENGGSIAVAACNAARPDAQ